MNEIKSTEDFIPLKSFPYIQEAYILLGKLQAEGVRAEIFDEHTVTIDPFYSNAIGGTKVMVRESDFARAQQILTKIENSEVFVYKTTFAGPGIRLFARLIDTMFTGFFAFLITSVYVLIVHPESPIPLIVFVTSYLILDMLVYTPISDRSGATVGKKNMGLKVRSYRTKLKPGWGQAILRGTVKFILVGAPAIISMWAFFNQQWGLFGMMMVYLIAVPLYLLTNNRYQTLYDKLSGVIVVQTSKERTEAPVTA